MVGCPSPVAYFSEIGVGGVVPAEPELLPNRSSPPADSSAVRTPSRSFSRAFKVPRPLPPWRCCISLHTWQHEVHTDCICTLMLAKHPASERTGATMPLRTTMQCHNAQLRCPRDISHTRRSIYTRSAQGTHRGLPLSVAERIMAYPTAPIRTSGVSRRSRPTFMQNAPLPTRQWPLPWPAYLRPP